MNLKLRIVLFCSIFLFGACQQAKEESSAATEENTRATEESITGKTAVSVAYPADTLHFESSINLQATASYLLKSDVKANTNGYITFIRIQPADPVKRGEVLFKLETKEARALGNTINALDQSFRFNGSTSVQSPVSGYVVLLHHQVGDYVQDGEVLATLSDASSFGFIAEVPYEYLSIVKSRKTLPISLPDGTVLQGNLAKVMPEADPVSQTVKILLKVPASNIPENLIGNILLSKATAFGLSVPKTAVLSNEDQSTFWVMKLTNDSTAVKTAIVKGVENDRFIEIKSGNLGIKDRVIVSGNFGLPDTARITLLKH